LAPDANNALQPFDAAALALVARLAVLYPADQTGPGLAQGMIERYVTAGQWAAAIDATTRFYQPQPGDAGSWALVRLQVRRATSEEDKTLAAHRKLGAELHPLLKEALAQTLKLLAANPIKASRQRAIQVAEGLVSRYAALDRPDLAEAVVAAAADTPAGAPLGDWALWVRANLHERRAGQSLAVAATEFEAQAKLPLDPDHKAELALLDQLIQKHPQSEYFSQAMERVAYISSIYQGYTSFDTARSVLADFLKTHGKLTAAERVEYQLVQLAAAKAQVAFDQRKDKSLPPAELLAEHAAAIDAIAAFLKAHPTGDYSPAIAAQLLEVARAYGGAGAWPVSRQVLARFAAALPDYRSPAFLKFLEAATYLGELDREYALALLQGPPSQPRSGTADDVSKLAMRDLRELLHGDKYDLNEAKNREGDRDKRLGEGLPAGRPDSPGAGAFGGPGGLGGFGAGGAFGPPAVGAGGIPAGAMPPTAGFAYPNGSASDASATALAMIRQAQQRQYQQIAMLEGQANQPQAEAQQPQAIALPWGSVLSEAEMKRQDEASDKAYAILVELVKTLPPSEAALAQHARGQVLWLFGYFEGKLRADRAIVLIKRYIADRPNDPARLALAFQAINDQLTWAAQRQPQERLDQAWVDRRHAKFEDARREIAAFIAACRDQADWVHQAQLLAVSSYLQEADLVAAHSAVRAGGLLVRSTDELLALLRQAPHHPETANFPARIWNVADRLQNLGQVDQAIYVLNRLPIHFPTDALSGQAVLRIANLYTADLSNPLKAVETYLEYLSLVGQDDNVRHQVFNMAQQLAQKQRFLEALHVYGVFVDSFPTDPLAAEALAAIGRTHQSNEAWEEAVKAYQRTLDEYPGLPTSVQIKLSIAECQINLSQWRAARKSYEDYLQAHPEDGQRAMAQARLDILKNLDRFETLLADGNVTRNKDDAQFQIGRIVLEQLQNPVKAVAEFRKVVSNYARSDLADDAQVEIGKALLSLNRLDDARAELLKVPEEYPGSPLADDALFLIGQSYEQQALRLASVTTARAWAEAYEQGQRGAYQRFAEEQTKEVQRQQVRREELKKAGKDVDLALDEASNAFRNRGNNDVNVLNFAQQAEIAAETESALQVANRQDRINDAYREAVAAYNRAATDYPLGDKTDQSLLRVAQILETQLKDRAAAMAIYQTIVKQFPGTPVAEDAAWKVAVFYEQEGKFTQASAAYRDFIRNYPASARVADAQFALAEVMEQLGRWVDAMDAYETFRQKFASHPKAQLALEQINWIKAYRK
jgi:TolA-binding protein